MAALGPKSEHRSPAINRVPVTRVRYKAIAVCQNRMVPVSQRAGRRLLVTVCRTYPVCESAGTSVSDVCDWLLSIAAMSSPSGPAPPDPSGAMDLSPLAVCLSAGVLLVNAAISLKLDLGMHWQLCIASTRCVRLFIGLFLPVPEKRHDACMLLLYSNLHASRPRRTSACLTGRLPLS